MSSELRLSGKEQLKGTSRNYGNGAARETHVLAREPKRNNKIR
jgi:hypothetical protein